MKCRVCKLAMPVGEAVCIDCYNARVEDVGYLQFELKKCKEKCERLEIELKSVRFKYKELKSKVKPRRRWKK